MILSVDVIVERFFSVTQPDSCPQFESPEPLLIPVGFEIPISFQGRNLEIYTVRAVRPAQPPINTIIKLCC